MKMKLSDKIDKVEDNILINRYDNGYMIQVTGRRNDDWQTCKIMCNSLEDLFVIINEYTSMPLSS